MSNKILDPSGFGEKIYNKFPKLYRDADRDDNVRYALKRYLTALGEGGYSYVIDDINRLLTLYDHDKVEMKFMPYLFKSFGFPYFNGLPEIYLRNLLPAIGDLYERKGTSEVVEYLTSIVSGVKSTVTVVTSKDRDGRFGKMLFGEGVFGDKGHTQGVVVTLELDYTAGNADFPDREQLIRIIKEFVPFYCFVTIVYSFVFIDEVKLIARDNWRHDYVDERMIEMSDYESEYREKTAIFGDALFGSAVFGRDKSVFLSVTDEYTENWTQKFAQEETIYIKGDGFYKESAIFGYGIFGSAVFGRGYYGESAIFGFAVIGNAVFGNNSKRSYELDVYHDKFKTFAGQDVNVPLRATEVLNDRQKSTVSDDITIYFSESGESDRIGNGSDTDTASNVGYIPRWSAIFGSENGQPFGKSKLGINRPYTLTDYFEDVITYIE